MNPLSSSKTHPANNPLPTTKAAQSFHFTSIFEEAKWFPGYPRAGYWILALNKMFWDLSKIVNQGTDIGKD